MAMKISTKGRYALRLMLDLALHDTGGISLSKRSPPGRRFPINILNKSSPSSAAPALSKASAAPKAATAWPSLPPSTLWGGSSG